MNKTVHFNNYKELFEKLKGMVKSTEQKIFEPDDFFCEHVNFFTKAFIVTMCVYLESYLKDVLMIIIDEMNKRLNSNTIPHDLIQWSLSSDKRKQEKLEFRNFRINIKRKDLDDFISGNPDKTKKLFGNFGINLEQDEIFCNQKNRLHTIIGKRNQIVHHNDEASDITFRDVIDYVDFFIEYIENIDSLVAEHITLPKIPT